MALGGDQQLGTATLDVRADTAPLKRDLADAKRATEKATKDIKRGLDKASKVAGVALLGLGATAWKATQAASDLGESMNKARQTFGAAAKSMPGFMGSVADSLGMARAEALDAAAGIGAMLIPMGSSRAEAARMSARMTQLAADLASFHNADPTDMLDRLRAGLSGESEPLKRFGIVLNETRTAQEAYRLGIAATGAQLTDAQKIQARYSLAIRDAGMANGDFARTSTGLANQQRILKAEVGDLAASFGQTFVPMATAAVGVLRDAAGWMERNRTTTMVLAGSVGGLAAAVLAVNTAVKVWGATTAATSALQGLFVTRTAAATTATVAQTGAQRGLNGAMRANPIGIVVTSLALLAAGAVVAYQKSATFRRVAGGAFDAVSAAAEVTSDVVGGIATAVDKLLGLGRDLKAFWDDLRGNSDTTAKDVAKAHQSIQKVTRQTAGTAHGAAAAYVAAEKERQVAVAGTSAVVEAFGKKADTIGNTVVRRWGASADRLVSAMAGKKDQAAAAGTQVGTSWITGVIAGVNANQQLLDATMGRSTQQANQAGAKAIRAHSPSEDAKEKIGYSIMEGAAKGVQEKAPRLTLALTSGVRDAIRQARANVPALMANLVGGVTAGIDAQLAKQLARLDPERGPEAAALRGMQAAREANQAARTEAGLQKAIADAAAAGNAAGPEGETPAQRTERLTQAQQQLTDAVVALNDYQADQAIAAEERRLGDLRTQLEDEATLRKGTAERTLTDLGDTFARGGITSGKEFTTKLNAALAEAEVPLATMGKLLGKAFRNAFVDTKGGLIDQVVAALVGPQAKGNALAAEVVRPLAVQHAEWAERRRDLVAKRDALRQQKAGASTLADAQKAIDTWDRREPVALGRGGILTEPTLGLLAERGYREAAIPLDGSRRSWQLLADAHAMMPGPGGASAGPLVHVARMEVRQPEDAQLVAARLSRNLATRGVGAT